jgi:hypothetical protein
MANSKNGGLRIAVGDARRARPRAVTDDPWCNDDDSDAPAPTSSPWWPDESSAEDDDGWSRATVGGAVGARVRRGYRRAMRAGDPCAARVAARRTERLRLRPRARA